MGESGENWHIEGDMGRFVFKVEESNTMTGKMGELSNREKGKIGATTLKNRFNRKNLQSKNDRREEIGT